MAKLTDYRVLTFDCYGTLIDWETGIWDALQPLIMRCGRSDLGRLAGEDCQVLRDPRLRR